jgi:hypothetical protein
LMVIESLHPWAGRATIRHHDADTAFHVAPHPTLPESDVANQLKTERMVDLAGHDRSRSPASIGDDTVNVVSATSR